MTVSARNVEQMNEIAALLRDNGVTVVDAPGWETRGQSGTFAPIRPLHHHDASTLLSGEWGAAGYIISARLSQWQGARCLDGVPKIMRCLAGVGWHAGVGGPYGAIPASSGNRYLMADEWANSGSEPYTDAATYARRIFSAAATEVLSDGALPGIGHKEWATPRGRKTDPAYDMDAFRRDVAATDLTPEPVPVPPTSEEDDDMTAQTTCCPGKDAALATEGCDRLVLAAAVPVSAVITAWEGPPPGKPYKPKSWENSYGPDNKLGVSTVAGSALRPDTRRVTVTGLSGGCLHVRAFKS